METSTDLTYLRLPLRGYLFLGKYGDSFRPKFFAGPTIGVLLNAESKYGDNKTDVKSAFNDFDLGLAIGAGFNARIAEATWFNLDACYTHGLLDVAENTDGSNRNIGVMAGVLFGF